LVGEANTNNTYLIFDSNFICHRAKNAIRNVNLTYDDLRTEIIFSFMHQIYKIGNDLDVHKMVFAWDSVVNFRKDVDPEYKKKDYPEETEKEKREREIIYRQFSQLRSHVLPNLGFRNIYYQTGMEGDDIIASITQNNPACKFAIISRDNDLFQLINKNTWMYDPVTRSHITQESFRGQWGIHPHEWATVKTIAGCSNDNVPNVPKVKEKTAIKYMKHRLKVTTKAYQDIMRSKALIEKNKRLVVLPFEGTKPIKIIPEQLCLIDFIDTFGKYGFESMLRNTWLKKWQDLLDLA